MIANPMKYNPAFLTDDELIAGFAVREHELAQLVDVVRDNTGASNQHVLVIGPRGYGKTTLVLRLAAAIRSDPALAAAWYPIVFSEEVEVASPGELWAEAVFFLGKQLDQPRWRDAYERLRREPDDERLRILALAELRSFAESEGKRLLLAVENLQTLFTEQITQDDAWTIRHTLQSEPWLMLVTTSTVRFDAIDKPNQALYELFRVFELESLTPRECAQMFSRLGAIQLDPLRGRALQILTGGNPRLLVVLARFVQGAPLHSLVDDFARLIDDHSDYFKGNIDALPSAERRIFTALAELWAPASAREVAENARLDVNKTSAFLTRLEQRGLVVARATSPRRKRYQVAERLYNLYWLMRRHGHASARVRFAVDFIAAYYDAEILASTCLGFAEQAVALQPTTRPLYVDTFVQLLDRLTGDARSRVVLKLSSQFLELPEFPAAARERILSERAAASRETEGLLIDVDAFIRARPFLYEFYELFFAEQRIRSLWETLWTPSIQSADPKTISAHHESLVRALADHWKRSNKAVHNILARVKRASEASFWELVVCGIIAAALDDDRGALRFARLLIERYPAQPWPRLVLLMLKYMAGDLGGETFIKHGQRLCARHPDSIALPLVLGLFSTMNDEKRAGQLFYRRVLSAEGALRLVDALIDIRDELMDYEQEIVLQPKWRGLVELTNDSTWESVFIYLARFTRDQLGQRETATAILQQAIGAMPDSCRLQLLLSLAAFAGNDIFVGVAAVTRAAEFRCERWQTLLGLGACFAIGHETARARELIISSWRRYTPKVQDSPLTQRVQEWLSGAAEDLPELPVLKLVAELARADFDDIQTLPRLASLGAAAPHPQILMFVSAACIGADRAAELHKFLANSPEAPRIEPLLVALARYLGDETPVPAEIEEVASDILKQFRLVAEISAVLRQSTQSSESTAAATTTTPSQ